MSMLNYALDYAKRGWPVIPLFPIRNGVCGCQKGKDCPSPGKHPQIPWKKTGGSIDPTQIKNWWGQCPDSNIGIPTGHKSGVLLLDLDGPDGFKSVENYTFPRTVKSQTGKGAHTLFKYPENITIKNAVRIMPGVDIRGEGGLFVAPPSRHISGNDYKWLVAPDESALADMPEWVLEKVKKQIEPEKTSDIPHKSNGNANHKAYVTAALAKEVEAVKTALPGTRNHQLNKSAFSLGQLVGAGALSQTEVEYELESAAMQTGLTGLEVKKTIASGINAGMQEPRVLPENKIVKFSLRGKSLIDNETGEILDTEPTEDEDELNAILLSFGAHDEGNSLAFMYLFGREFLYCKAFGWLAFNGKFWTTDMAESLLDKRMVECLKRRSISAVKLFEGNSLAKETIKAATPNSMKVAALKDRLCRKLEILAEEFDNNPDLLNCNNGVVNLRTGELTEHNKNQRFTYATKINYVPGASTKHWIDFLEQVVGNWEEIKDFLKMAVGYSLTGHTKEECLFYIYGPTRSGKGTFSEIIMAMLGLRLSIEVDFNTFTAKREADSSNFDLAPLKPARMIFASESQRHQSLNTAKIKSMTGGNMIRCCFKHRDHFTYQPQFKMWMSSNWAVNGDVDDDALWGRLRVIEFPNSFLDKEDKHLKDKLKSEKVLEGVLAWAVEGATQWYKNEGGLKTPAKVKETTQKHRSEGDFVQTWLDECTEKDDTYWSANSEIIHSYHKWCEINGVEAKQIKSLSISFRTKGYATGILKRSGNKVEKGVQGFSIIP